jgi:hypothetical protein
MTILYGLVLDQAAFRTQILYNLCCCVAKILLRSYLKHPSPTMVSCVDTFEDYQKNPHCSRNINAGFIHIGIQLGSLWRILRRRMMLRRRKLWRRSGILRRRLWRRRMLWRRRGMWRRRRILRRRMMWRRRRILSYPSSKNRTEASIHVSMMFESHIQ